MKKFSLHRLLVEHCLQKKIIEFTPEKWQQGIGEICHSCHNKLEAEDCISLCRCYLFCHEQCFLKDFSPYIFDNQLPTCTRCQEYVQFEYSYFHRWECNKKPLHIVGLVVAAAILFTLLGLVASGTVRGTLSDGAGYTIFTIGLLLLIFSAVYSNKKRYIDLDKVKIVNTNMLSAPETDTAMKNQDYDNDLKHNIHNNHSDKAL